MIIIERTLKCIHKKNCILKVKEKRVKKKIEL